MKRVIDTNIQTKGNNATLTSSEAHNELIRVGETFRYTYTGSARATVHVYVSQATSSVVKYGISNDNLILVTYSYTPDTNPLLINLSSRQTLWMRAASDIHVRLIVVGEES
jgi:hypothetical protein